MNKIIIDKADPRQHDFNHFEKPELTLENVGENPYDLFEKWYMVAKETEVSDANAMSLATIDKNNIPNVRIVLLKDFDNNGFTFFSNYQSQKGQELDYNMNASLCFHWKSQLQQVRIQGIVKKISPQESDDYFATRDRNSQIGAYVSCQSKPVTHRQKLLDDLHDFQDKFKNTDIIKRPEYWGGYILQPLKIEYWQNGAFRLHDRFIFERFSLEDSWQTYKLYP
jgi:pyridoxamine 5'-phosphate oxidase